MTEEGPEGYSAHLMGRGHVGRRTVCKIPEECRLCEVPGCQAALPSAAALYPAQTGDSCSELREEQKWDLPWAHEARS